MSLYDLIENDLTENDCVSNSDNESNDDKNDQIKNKIKLVSDINYVDSIEYLKYSHQYLHDKLIIANAIYKEKHRDSYKFFKEIGLIKSSEKYTLEYYIKTNYKLINNVLEINSKKIQEKNLLSDPKKFFKKERLHKPIKLSIKIDNQTIKGTLFDKAISYVYDNSIDFLTIVRSIKSVDEINEIIVKNKIINSDEMMFSLFGTQLFEIKKDIDNMFTNMLPCKIIFSHDSKTYGYPDFIADNWIIDVKTSKSNVINMKNYLQVIAYAICSGINNVCLYDIELGYIYKGTISHETIEKIKKNCNLC